MKSTPMRGVKETLKPNAYKQWERGSPEVNPFRGQMTGIRDQKEFAAVVRIFSF